MAGEGEEIQTLNDDPSSMSAKLARMASVEAPTGKEDGLEAARTADAEAQAAAEREAQEAEEAARIAREAEAGTKTAAEIAAEEEAARVAAEAAKLEPSKRENWTVEDYEKAIKASETRMHTATTETKTEREAREAAETEATRLREENEQLKAAQDEQKRIEEAAKSFPKLKEKYSQAMKKIQAIKIDRDAEGNLVYPPDYDDQVAEAWASTGIDPEQLARDAARIAKEELKREQEAERTRIAESDKATEGERIRARAESMAQEQFGLDMTKGSADQRLFDTFVQELATDPDHEMRGKPFEEQVKWASNGVKQILGQKIEMTDAERKLALENQKRNAVLERGVTRQVVPEQPKQRSMNEILTGHPATAP